MIQLGKNQYPTGTKNAIQYFWDFGKFEIRTYENNFSVLDSDIEKREGNCFFNPSKQNSKYTSTEIEIPVNVIERKNKLNLDLTLRKESIGNVDRKEGKIYFSLNSDSQLIAKLGDKEAITNDIEIIENRKAINVVSLGLEFPYIEVPPEVENAFMKAKNRKIMENCHLIYVGKSLLTGKDYFKFNNPIPPEKWDCVEEYFEDFGVSVSGLNGWLTSQPEKVEAALGIKHSVSDRMAEIKKHENEAKAFQEAEFSLKIK